MIKRVNRTSFLYLLFALTVLMVSWEHNRTLAAIVQGPIPQESIRLRILAHSDSPGDQALKRRVRDAITAQMNQWVAEPGTLEEARAIVRDRLAELEEVVGQEIRRSGYRYSYQVELGIIPFPAKMYGNTPYPAGDYEALRVTIGAGAGQNWWCVLFPPLCFVSAAKGEAIGQEPSIKIQADDNRVEKSDSNSEQEANSEDGGSEERLQEGLDRQSLAESPEQPRKYGFFFWEKLKSWFA